MKKYIVPIIAFFLIMLSLVVYGVTRAVERGAYYRAVSDHIIHYSQNMLEYPLAWDGAESSFLSHANARAFADAVTRTDTFFLLFPPDVEGAERVSVEFMDGATIEVYDGGVNDKGKDVAYICHKWNNDTDWFKCSGFNTFRRAKECAGREGFHDVNYPTA